MNIFFLDKDINKSVQYHVDKHVTKMRLELAQLASTAHWVTGGKAPYKRTHENHPSAKWTRESIDNYMYVVNLGLQLCEECRFRFNTETQLTEGVLQWLKSNPPNLPKIGFTIPKLAMDKKFVISEVPKKGQTLIDWAVVNYRNYYNHGKTHLFKWKNRKIPKWISPLKPEVELED